MTARHLKLETDLEIINNLLNKRYANGHGLDSGTKSHLTRRREEIQQQLQKIKAA
tara:strand:+ start:143 stop:307 length:165 start_codon:yes stop_codon:yes gene_type:complete